MESLLPDITILYGSQTGNAEDLAKRVGHKAKSFGYRVLVETIDDFPLKLLPKQNFVLFICSTTGHGQEPENMKNFYNFIRRRDLPLDCLSSLKFAVYGLGDSSYAKFNYISKILFKRLKECGGQPIQELVLGNEQHKLGCDGIIYPVLDKLWLKLKEEPCSGEPLIGTKELSHSSMPEKSYTAMLYPSGEGPKPCDKFREDFISKYNMRNAHCTKNQRLTPEGHFQDTRFLCFRSDEKLNYEPGDVCVVLPANLDENVKLFIETLNLDPNQRFSLTKKDPNYMVDYLYDFVPDGLTVGDLVKYYLDIQSVPKRSFFQFLWPFSDNELEKNKLKEFASTEGQEEVYEYCTKPKRNILEVLLDFPRTIKNIKFEYLFDLIPPIKSRSFSFASASSAHPHEVHLIVGVVEYRTSMRDPRKGLCSNYLAKISTTDTVSLSKPSSESRLRFFIGRTSFKLPKNDSTPIIMVGPGLGIAPFRSFIQDRASRIDRFFEEENKVDRLDYYNTLYFGCRYRNVDFYFKDELVEYARKDVIELWVACSRERAQEYVQDIMRRNSHIIKELVRKHNAHIYIAGNLKLPEDLRKLLVSKILNDEHEDSGETSESEKFVALLESQYRIQYDCW